jgi:23S rRNA (cytosine1962-C5)-methyltransferase
MIKIEVTSRSAAKLRQGYPWVFRSEIKNLQDLSDLQPGDPVVFTQGNQVLSHGYMHPSNQLAGRILRFGDQPVTQEWIHHLIKRALATREQLYSTPYYRLIFAESDGLPGLIIDRFASILVAQINTAGIHRLWPIISRCLQELFPQSTLIMKNDSAHRIAEGLAAESCVDWGQIDNEECWVFENNLWYLCKPLTGQKTGWFFDQRDHRKNVGLLSAHKDVLDVFCHTGGFGLAAAHFGAQSVTLVDRSHLALELAQKSAAKNKLRVPLTYIEGSAFEILDNLHRERLHYDVVVVDPPAFVKVKKDYASGLKGYQKLARLASPLVKPGGVLYFGSCSSHVSLDELRGAVETGLCQQGSHYQLFAFGGAAADHPIHLQLPETNYLKGLYYRKLDETKF